MFKGKTRHAVDVDKTHGIGEKRIVRRWFMVASRAGVRIFAQNGHDLELLEEIKHPAGKGPESSMGTDRPGQTHDRHSQKGIPTHSYSHEESLLEHENNVFAKLIADRLDKGRVQRKFTHVTLVAEPKFMGLIGSHVSKELEKLIDNRIEKNLCQYSGHELKDRLLPKI